MSEQPKSAMSGADSMVSAEYPNKAGRTDRESVELKPSIESAPVVAEVRRASIDLEGIRHRLENAPKWNNDDLGCMYEDDVRTLFAAVARLTAERDELLSVKRSLSDQLIRSRGQEAATYTDLEILRVRLRGLEQQWRKSRNATCYADELARLLTTPEEPEK
jgi:hypothetical protein